MKSKQPPEAQQLQEFNEVIDQEFYRLDIPFKSGSHAILATLAAYETMSGTATAKRPLPALGSAVNDYKFALQHALSAIQRRHNTRKIDHKHERLSKNDFRAASSLLETANQYHDAVCALTSAFAQNSHSELHGAWHLSLKRPPAGIRHEALDGILDEMEQIESALSNARRAWSTRPESIGEISRREAALNSRGRLRLPDDLPLLKSISRIHLSAPRSIPGNWNLGTLRGSTVCDILRAITSFAAYREIQIGIASEKFGLHRPPADATVWKERRERFIDSITTLTGLKTDKADRIVTELTFGEGTSSPDPALQPIFESSDRTFVYLPLRLIGTSRIERNYLTLAARTRKSEFDKASHVFAPSMTRRVISALQEESDWQIFERVNIPHKKRLGDIDVAVICSRSNAILLLELKSALTVADIREHLNRQDTARNACEKHAKRIEAVKLNPGDLLAKVGLNSQAPWRVFGCVVFPDFTTEPHHEVAVVSEALVRIAIKQTDNLHAIAEWLQSEDYLPR